MTGRVRGENMVSGVGMTFQEIADELGISNARAQQLVNSGLRKMKAYNMGILLKMQQEAEGLERKEATR